MASLIPRFGFFVCLSCYLAANIGSTTPARNCRSFRYAADLKAAFSAVGVPNHDQCMRRDVGILLRHLAHDVLTFAGGVREHCLLTIAQQKSLESGTRIPAELLPPVDDEDTDAGILGSGDDEEKEICELPTLNLDDSTLQSADVAISSPSRLMLGPTGSGVQPLLIATTKMMNFLHDAIPRRSRSGSVIERHHVLEQRGRELKLRAHHLGTTEGYYVQLLRVRAAIASLNESTVQKIACQYAFPSCAPESEDQPRSLLAGDSRSCMRWQASSVLVHGMTGEVKASIEQSFTTRFMAEQCRSVLSQLAPEASSSQSRSQQISACFTQSPQVCDGRPVYKCPGHLQTTDNPDHWVGQLYLSMLSGFTGLSAITTPSNASALATCSFPCGVRCRNKDGVSDSEALVLRRLRVAWFFLILVSLIFCVIVVVAKRDVALQYPQRHSLYMLVIFTVWAIHYIPAGVTDTDVLLCHADNTARMLGTYTDSMLCNVTFVLFYGFSIVFLCMAVFGCASLWLLARDLNPMINPTISSSNRNPVIFGEVMTILISVACGGIGAGLVLARKNVFPLVSAGYCTVFKDDIVGAVQVPFGLAIALQAIFLVAAAVNLVKDRRRARLNRQYSVQRMLSDQEPFQRVLNSMYASCIHFVWTIISFVYIVFSVREGERPAPPVALYPFECTLATCGASTCPPSSITSPHFFAIVAAFLSLTGLFGGIFAVVVIALSAHKSKHSHTEQPPPPVVTTKQLTSVSLNVTEFPPPPDIEEWQSPIIRRFSNPADNRNSTAF